MADIDALIRSIKKHEGLWNINNSSYRSKKRKGQIWRQISTELGIDEGTCRKKWKNLRDGFVRQDIRGCDGEHSWKYYDKLLFLKNQRIPRKLRRSDSVRRVHRNRQKSSVPKFNKETHFMEETEAHTEESNHKYENGADTETADITELLQEVEKTGSDEEQLDDEQTLRNPLLIGSMTNGDYVDSILERPTSCPSNAMPPTSAMEDHTDEDALFMQSILMKMKKMPLIDKNSLKLNILRMSIEIEEKILINSKS